MSLCVPISEGFALLAHKAALGSSMASGALCSQTGTPDRALLREPIDQVGIALIGGIDPEGVVGYDPGPAPPPPRLAYAAIDRAEDAMATGGDNSTEKTAPSQAELLPSDRAPSVVASENKAPFALDADFDSDNRKGDFTFSGGFSSFEGLNAKASLTIRSLRERQQEVSASTQHSDLQTLFELGFTDARFLGDDALFSARLFYNRLDAVGFTRNVRKSPFEQDSRGLSLYVGKKVANNVSLSTQYRLSKDIIRLDGRNSGQACDPATYSSAICASLGRRTASVLSLGITLDNRDSSTSPRNGVRVRLVQDFAGLGGATRYGRSRVAADGHVPLGGDWQFYVGAEAGVIAGSSRRIPIFDRFYLGGSSLRGFDLRGVGPRLQLAGSGANTLPLDTAIGGRGYYVARVELGIPVGPKLGKTGIKLIVFADVGSVFGGSRRGILPGETLVGNSARPRVSLGAGLGWETPLGMLRVDAARPVVKQAGDRRQTFSISLGSTF
jgi:outer membrane protein assembly complex protein YaeT